MTFLDKDNVKLTQEEKMKLQTHKGVFAVIMGYLKAERGKIAPSVFNKLTAKLGFEKHNKDELKEIGRQINSDEVLYSLYEKGFERKIKLDELPNIINKSGDLTEEDVFAQVTNFLIDNEDNNARLRELRKLQREGVYMNILMRNVKEHLVEELKGMPKAKYLKTEVPEPRKGDRSLILCFSDWHIGVLVYNNTTGGYSLDKLNSSIQDTINETVKLIKEMDIKHVYVLNLGDLTEHINLRNSNQAFDAELTLAEQISKAVRITSDMLSVLSKHVHITYGHVAGNHDRLQTNKQDAISGDTTAYIVIDQLIMLQEEFGQLPNVTILDNREDIYELDLEVAGKHIKAVHGDREKKTGTKISKHIKDNPIDILYMGHYHSVDISQEDYARFAVTVGSPQGENDYSKSLNAPTTYGSQMITILEEGKASPMFYPIMFKGGRFI